ncbi:hypothetical protein CPB84DRAFT_1854453 [Gymnopilus junonius]|uniref:F-box domain-containing protein n=1 Tax=Gymnopilus junonius TaxID=109634 RepID=A0A9P5NAT7_GYMJU|nr:hypothetical protein CPB84DRAFT_1854453 [Gymnopilus junonius]
MPPKPATLNAFERELFSLVTGQSYEDTMPGDVGRRRHSIPEGSNGTSKHKSGNKSPNKKRPRQRGKVSDEEEVAQSREGLELLPTLPLDVLFEIFGFLDPQDLVAWAQTNKFFRNNLLAPSTICIWKTARLRYDAPEPLKNISEIAWAISLFGDTCQFLVGANRIFPANSRFFWNTDVDRIIEKVEQYQNYIRTGHPGAEQALEDFKEQQCAAE